MKKRRKSSVAAWTQVGNTWSTYVRALGKVALQGVADALEKTAEALHQTDRVQEQKSSHHAAVDVKGEPAAQKTLHE